MDNINPQDKGDGIPEDQIISNGKAYLREEHEEWLKKEPSEGKVRQCSLRINAARRRVQVMELRLRGKSFRQIAELLGTSVTTVCRDYKITMQEYASQANETASDVRALECKRLDDLQNEMWQQLAEARSEKVDESGDTIPRSAQDQNASLGTVNAIIRIMERRAKLAGLDAPTKKTIDIRKVDDIAQTVAKVALRYIPVERRASFAGEITSVLEEALGGDGSQSQIPIGKQLTGSPLNSAAMTLPSDSQES